MNYIQKNDLINFQYLQIPKKIWNMFLMNEMKEITFKIYIEFFDRLKLSNYNNWIDESGNVYIKYSYDELLSILNLNSRKSISGALKELEKLNLIIKQKGFNTSTKFYLTNILETYIKEIKTDFTSTAIKSETKNNYSDIFNKFNLKKSTILNLAKLEINYTKEELEAFLLYCKENKLLDGYIYNFIKNREDIKELDIKIKDKSKIKNNIINYYVEKYNSYMHQDEEYKKFNNFEKIKMELLEELKNELIKKKLDLNDYEEIFKKEIEK